MSPNPFIAGMLDKSEEPTAPTIKLHETPDAAALNLPIKGAGLVVPRIREDAGVLRSDDELY